LARPGVPRDVDELAARDVEVDVTDGVGVRPGVGLGDVLELDHLPLSNSVSVGAPATLIASSTAANAASSSMLSSSSALGARATLPGRLATAVCPRGRSGSVPTATW